MKKLFCKKTWDKNCFLDHNIYLARNLVNKDIFNYKDRICHVVVRENRTTEIGGTDEL